MWLGGLVQPPLPYPWVPYETPPDLDTLRRVVEGLDRLQRRIRT